MHTATLQDTDMSTWADGTRHYLTDDGRHFAVEATILADGASVIPVGAQPMINELLTLVGDGRAALKQIMRPTVIFECTDDGLAIDLTPLWTFAAGTTHEDALAMAGYAVVEHLI